MRISYFRSIIILTIFFVSTVFVVSPYTYIKIIVIIFVLFLGLIYYKVDLKYPFVWLAPFLVLYNISVCILNILGVREVSNENTLLNITFLALFSFFIFCIIFISQKKKHIPNIKYINNLSIKIIGKIFLLLCFILILYVPMFLKSGISSKTEMSQSGGLLGYSFISRIYIFMYIFLYLYKLLSSRKIPVKLLVSATCISLLISLFLGEREILFSVILSSIIGFCFIHKIQIKKLLIGSSIMICVFPILAATKQITNKNNISLGESGIFVEILQGEFLSSGRNIETLLNNESSWEYQHGEGLIKGIGRSIIPPSILRINNSTAWFNENYNDRAHLGFGLGFSYLGEGYLQFGYIGVVIWIFILSICLKYLYKYAFKNILGSTIYLFIIPFFIYAMRGDISYLITILIKQVPFCSCIIIFIHNYYKCFNKQILI